MSDTFSPRINEEQEEETAPGRDDIFEIESELPEVEDTDDGGAYVTMSDAAEVKDDSHWANLAEDMDESELQMIALDLVQKIERDQESRKKRVEQYEEGLRRTGLGDDAPGGAQFNGASKAVHPIITEACIDFQARIMKEMMPFDGPVKDKVLGEATDEKVQKARRKTRFLNWQITEQMPEFRSEMEQMETQVPLGGSQYFGLYYDKAMRRPVPEFVPVDDVLLPFAASNFYSAQRKTRVLHLTQMEYERRVEAGLYRDLELVPESQSPDATAAEKANQKIEGKSESSYNEDGLRDVYESYAMQEIEDDDHACPYIVTIDKPTNKVLSIYRNWYPDDEQEKAIDHLFEFDFIRWRGAYGIGIPHIAGGLAGAITGALRALLDSALINTIPTLLKLKGGSRGGESLTIQPTEVAEVDGALSPDQDIRKTMMPIPFNPPSPVLMDLLGFLTTAAKGVVRTSMDNEAMDTNQNTPVGTQLSRVEQGMVVFSSIFMRQFMSMNRVLKRLHEIDRDYLEDMQLPELDDEMFVNPEDFQGPIDVIPVANPTIYSEQQRLAQFTALRQAAVQFPQLYNQAEIERAFVKDVLKINNGDKFLNVPPEPERRTATAENVALMSANDKIEAYPDQDDIAHLQTHTDFFQNPMLGANPVVLMKSLAQLVPHLIKHLSSYYAKQVEAAVPVVKMKLGMMKAMALGSTAGDNFQEPDDDQILAAAALHVNQQMPQHPVLSKTIPFIQQLSQQLQQSMPQDPAKLAATKIQAEAQASAQKAQSDLQKQQQDFALAQANAQLESAKAKMENDVANRQLQLDAMAMQLESARQQRQEQSEAQQQQMDWFETQMRVSVEQKNIINEQRSQELAAQQQAFEQRIAAQQLAQESAATAFNQRIEAMKVELEGAKQRLAEFVAGQQANLDREQAAMDRTALAHDVATSVATATKQPPMTRTVKFKKGVDGSIEGGEITDSQG
tara:strand:- start:4234 stop:7116 length:2883 start_codon:yes stop_codon:yes gene_type:complete